MKNFIVPIDFSAESILGLEIPVLFSQQQPVNIQMVYVITSITDYHPSSVQDEYNFAEEKFNKVIADIEPRLGKDSKIRFIIKKGKVFREVVSQVNSYNRAVVSASTHGASGFEELFVGSNALKIMAATNKPVFTIRQAPAPKQIKKIVLPIKLHPDTRQKLPIALQIAELFGAEVHLVSISTRKSKRDLERLRTYSAQCEGFLKSHKIKPVVKTITGDALPTLTLNYAEAVGADLVVMMSSAIDKWNVFLGSYAQQMLNRSHLPLLAIKPRVKQLPSGFRTFG